MAKRSKASHNGSFYLKVTSLDSDKWILMYQSYEDGKRKQKTVEEFIYRNLGLNKDLSIAEAKERIKRINENRSLERRKILDAGQRVLELRTLNKALFKPEDIQAFQEFLTKENAVNGSSETHLKKLFSHFNFIQKMIVGHLKCQPVHYKEKTREIYEYLQKKKVSVHYSERLISMTNRWGQFISKRYDTYFEPVSRPKGKVRANIAKIQKTKRGTDSELGVRTESLPMNWDLLSQTRPRLSDKFYNWIFISFALGLRPSEVDSLKTDQFWKLGIDRSTRVPFIEIYQTKLTSIDEEKRWKKIPLLFSQQQEAVIKIKSQSFQRPHSKTMRKYFKGNYTLYAGRKGFTDWHLEKGQNLENISLWLGHKSIETTWQSYKDKDTVRYTPTDEIMNLLKRTVGKE